jgi:hypothetical protein
MNRIEPSPRCLVCGMNIRARLLACDLVRLRAEFARMMANGICDDCQSDRMEAAQEYENAVAEIRLVTFMGAGWSSTRPPEMHPALAQAVKRRNAAAAWCVRLKMWREENR